MENALDLVIKGIKCDNPDCDYNDMSVKVEDYKDWLNKPCPKCGENLLTKKDYKNTKRLIAFTKIMNKILPKCKPEDKKANMRIDMNGTGEMKFDIKIEE